MQQWEYKVISKAEPSEDELNALGNDRWELVSVYVSSEIPSGPPPVFKGEDLHGNATQRYILSKPTWVFKRPKQN